MKMKKKFATASDAWSKAYALRRAGFDAWVRGAVCTVIIDRCVDALSVFDGWKCYM